MLQLLVTLLSPPFFFPFVIFILLRQLCRRCCCRPKQRPLAAGQLRRPDPPPGWCCSIFAQCWGHVSINPSTNRVTLDEEAVDMLTAAINSACARQFDRIQQINRISDVDSISSNSYGEIQNQARFESGLRQAPPPPIMLNGASATLPSVVVEKENKKSNDCRPFKKTKFQAPAVTAVNSEQSLQNPSEINGMNEDGIIE